MGPGEANEGDRGEAGRDSDITARSGTDASGEFRGGGQGGRAAADAGEDSGRGDGKGDERDRYFEDEREAQRIRLVGGNRLISVQGEGVNLRGAGSSNAAGTPPR